MESNELILRKQFQTTLNVTEVKINVSDELRCRFQAPRTELKEALQQINLDLL